MRLGEVGRSAERAVQAEQLFIHITKFKYPMCLSLLQTYSNRSWWEWCERKTPFSVQSMRCGQWIHHTGQKPSHIRFFPKSHSVCTHSTASCSWHASSSAPVKPQRTNTVVLTLIFLLHSWRKSDLKTRFLLGIKIVALNIQCLFISHCFH